MVEGAIKSKQSAFSRNVMEAIRCGIYPVGAKLPSERGLCVRYGLSRNTIREGLSELLAAGMLVRCGRSAVVSGEALRLIEAGRGEKARRVFVMLQLSMYENPIFRAMFERMRYGLEGQATCVVIFYEDFSAELLPDLGETDAVVLMGGSPHPLQIRELERRCAGVVHLNRQDNFSYCIMPDNYAAGREVASYLVAQGHRRIGIALCDPEHPDEFGDRFRGARDYLREVGLELLAAPVDGMQPPLKRMSDFVQTYRRQGVTAMLCVKDISALMLYEYARQEGIAIPEDLSVVGFDDRCYTANVRPALTTVRYPVETMADAAVETIRRLLRGERPAALQQIAMVLLRRESVAKVAVNH